MASRATGLSAEPAVQQMWKQWLYITHDAGISLEKWGGSSVGRRYIGGQFRSINVGGKYMGDQFRAIREGYKAGSFLKGWKGLWKVNLRQEQESE